MNETLIRNLSPKEDSVKSLADSLAKYGFTVESDDHTIFVTRPGKIWKFGLYTNVKAIEMIIRDLDERFINGK